MKDPDDKLMLELCCNFLEDKDKKVAKYLKKKFDLEQLQNGTPKLQEIISKHFEKPVSRKPKNFVERQILRPTKPGRFVKAFNTKKRAPINTRNLKCFKCQKIGHISLDCRGIKCFNCQKLGHISYECKEEPNNDRYSKFKCHICGEEGHISRACPKNETHNDCFNCGQAGHRAKECQEEKKQRTCHICNEVEHLAKDCPKNPNICFKCNGRGHKAHNCPAQSDGCFKCTENDHQKKDGPGTVTSSNSVHELTESEPED